MAPRPWFRTLRDQLAALPEGDFDLAFLQLLAAWARQLPAWYPRLPDPGRYLREGWLDSLLETLPAGVHDSAPPVSILPEKLYPPFDTADPFGVTSPLAVLYLATQHARLTNAETRSRGLVFTTRPAARELLRWVTTHLIPRFDAPLCILEPSAGAGIFWECLIADRLEALPEADRFPVLIDLFSQHLYALEIDPLLASLLRFRSQVALLLLQCQQPTLGEALPCEPVRLSLQVLCRDALAPEPLPATWPRAFDLVIGNPPFGYAEALSEEQVRDWQLRYDLAQGHFDRSWLFIEQAVRWLTPGGLLALVLPEGVRYRPQAAKVRLWLARHTDLLVSWDFETRFPGTHMHGIYVVGRRRSRPLDHPSALANSPVQLAVAGEARTVPLGELMLVRRGEEVGIDRCVPLREQPDYFPTLRGRDLTPLGNLNFVIGLPDVQKPMAWYQTSKILVRKTGRQPVITLNLLGGAVVLQSVYMLMARPACNRLDELLALGWLLSIPPFADQLALGAGQKRTFPQITQQTLRQLSVPPLDELRVLAQRLAEIAPLFATTGVLHVQDAVTLAESGLAQDIAGRYSHLEVPRSDWRAD